MLLQVTEPDFNQVNWCQKLKCQAYYYIKQSTMFSYFDTVYAYERQTEWTALSQDNQIT